MPTILMPRNPLNNFGRLMFILLVLIFVLVGLILSSCVVTQKQRDRFCASCPTHEKDISWTDTTKKKVTMVRDTAWKILEVPILGPVQYLPHPCAKLCDSLGHMKPVDIVQYKKGMILEIKSVGDSLRGSCAEDSLRQITEKQKIEIDVTHQAYREKIMQILQERKTPWYDIAGRWALGIDIMALLILIILGILHLYHGWIPIKIDPKDWG